MFVEVKLVNLNGETIAELGRQGEILVRGPNVTPGYWGLPRGDRAGDRQGRLVPHRRRRLLRRGRFPHHQRPHQGHDHHRRRERLSGRGRERVDASPGDRRGRGDRRAGPSNGARTSSPSLRSSPANSLTIETLRDFAGECLARYKLPKPARNRRRRCRATRRARFSSTSSARPSRSGRPRRSSVWRGGFDGGAGSEQ